MTHDPDPQIADLLRADLLRDAPAERDPVFRVAVLDRLERAKYRRRLVALLAGAAVLAAIAVTGVSLGGAAREATGVVLIGAALAAAYFILAPAAAQLFARFR
jgi:hypothetical protein